MHLSTVIHLFTLYLINSLNINNITSPIKLTNLFVNDTSLNIGISPSFMTYYINPNDSTRTKYIWYGMLGDLNDSVSTVGSYIKSTIFTSNFTEYNSSIQIPFTIETSDKEWAVAGNSMCTSPLTNDIITCWMHQKAENVIIECKVYYTKTNIFSDIIQISETSLKNKIIDGFINVLCFKDSYFIPWIRYNHVNRSTIVLGVVLDLNGNILFNEISLSSSYTEPYWITSISTTKGGSTFSVQQINASATEIFLIYCTLIEQVSSPIYVDLPQMISIYGYYTNINASTCPINIYNESINQIAPTENGPPDCWTEILNFRNDCCYVSIYTSNSSEDESSDHLNVLGTVTDIYGNYIEFEEYSDTQNMLLVNDTAEGTNVEIVSLPMISNNNTQYFMIVYGNGTYNKWDNYVAGNVAASVYYLQWNNTEKKYHLFHESIFNLVCLVNGSSSGDLDTQFDDFVTYIMPHTNQLFISWEQNAWDGGWRDNLNDNLYGQIFEIK